jgi:hypothetical protein
MLNLEWYFTEIELEDLSKILKENNLEYAIFYQTLEPKIKDMFYYLLPNDFRTFVRITAQLVLEELIK